MNKARKIFFSLFFFWHQIFLPASQLASENYKKKKITIVIKTYITLEQKEMLWTRELQELFKKKKKVLPLEKYSILLKSLEQL